MNVELNFTPPPRHLDSVEAPSGRPVGSDEVERIERLYREHGPAVFGYLRHMAGARVPAEDLLQETFVQVLRRPDRLQRAVSPRAWLLGIARRLALNALRRRRVMERLPEQVPDRATDQPDDSLGSMRAAIRALPPQQREALELRLAAELSYEEIAAVLEIPVGTVRSRLHHAVRRLRETLKTVND